MNADAAPPSSPAAARNADAIGRVLGDWLGTRGGTLLEIGCGTGQHAAALSEHVPALHWLPTDVEPDVETILAWRARAAAPARVAAPAALDVGDAARWRQFSGIDAVLTVNTLHIMPWPSVVDLFRHAAAACRDGARLLVYGPMHVGGSPTGPGNARFDAALRSADPDRGIRDLESVLDAAAAHGWIELARYRMPADNRMIVWRRGPA